MEHRDAKMEATPNLYDRLNEINMLEFERAQAKRSLHTAELIAEFIYGH